MPRNTVGVKNPYSNEIFAEIVAKGEKRLGAHNFIGHGVAVHHTKQPHVTIEQLILDVEERMGDEYTEVFAKAVVSIKDITDYKGSR